MSIVHEVDDSRSDVCTWGVVMDHVGATAEAVTDGETFPVGGHMRIDGEGVAFLVEAENVLDTGLVSP